MRQMRLCQSDGMAKVWRKKGSAHTSSSVKHSGSNIMAWASSGTGSLIVIDDLTHNGSRKNEVRSLATLARSILAGKYESGYN